MLNERTLDISSFERAITLKISLIKIEHENSRFDEEKNEAFLGVNPENSLVSTHFFPSTDKKCKQCTFK